MPDTIPNTAAKQMMIAGSLNDAFLVCMIAAPFSWFCSIRPTAFKNENSTIVLLVSTPVRKIGVARHDVLGGNEDFLVVAVSC